MNLKLFFPLALSALLSCCTAIPQTSIQMRIDASKQLNVDPEQVSLPVRLKIYQLSDVTLFNEATFRQLWKSDVNVLGSTLLDKKELTINPGDTQIIKMTRRPEAEYLAVVGIFRRHEDNDWKSVKQLPGQIKTILKQLVVVAKNNSVEIQ